MSGLATMWAFLRKDLEDALRSHTLVLVMIGPVLMSVFFARFFTGDDVRNPVVFVCNSGASGFEQALKTTGLFRVTPESDWDVCCERVKEGNGVGAVLIPESFDADIRSDSYPVLQLVVNESNLTQATVFREGVRGALRALAKQELPADVRVTKINAYTGDAKLAILPIWALFTCLGGLMVTSSSLVEEIESRTLDAVLMTPASWAGVLVGKVGAGFVMAWASTALVLLLNRDGQGSLAAMLLFVTLGALVFAVGGIVLGLLARNQSLANAVSSVLYMVLFVPIALADLSKIMRSVSMWLPTWYFYDGVSKALLSVPDWHCLGNDALGLLVGLVALFAIGAWALRRMRLAA